MFRKPSEITNSTKNSTTTASTNVIKTNSRKIKEYSSSILSTTNSIRSSSTSSISQAFQQSSFKRVIESASYSSGLSRLKPNSSLNYKTASFPTVSDSKQYLTSPFPNFYDLRRTPECTSLRDPKIEGITKISPITSSTNSNPFLTEFSRYKNSDKKQLIDAKKFNSTLVGNGYQSNVSTPTHVSTTAFNNSAIKSGAIPKIQNIVPTKKLKPGIMYIFNHEKFDTNDNERFGTEFDVKRLLQTFGKFNIEVKIFSNLRLRDIKAKMNEIQGKNYSKNFCIMITILSHGERREVIMAKDEPYAIHDVIVQPLLRNKTLELKPKILIIQACKGSIDLRYPFHDSSTKICNPLEMIICYSTFEGYVSYRDSSGTPFIQTLCSMLEAHGHDTRIEDIMQMVREEVVKLTGYKQTPSVSTTLIKPFIFGNNI